MKSIFFGKYKSIVIAISVFVSLVAGVMSLNFVISTQLANDAVGISLAGRQRMISQRLFKDLLNLHRVAENGGDVEAIEKRVSQTAALFDMTLEAFIKGGKTLGSNNSEVVLESVKSDTGLRSLEEAMILWQPFKRLLDTVFAEKTNISWLKTLSAVLEYSRQYNDEIINYLDGLIITLHSESSNTNAIVASQQQMLAQRLAKEILELKETVKAGDDLRKPLEDLSATVMHFDSILNALHKGGAITGVDGTLIRLRPVKSAKGQQALAATAEVWASYERLLQSLLAEATETRWLGQLAEVIAYGRESNLTLLILMDDLAAELERLAIMKATRLRYLQAAAIVAAFLFFFIVMLHFVKKLRQSDAMAEKAQKDTENILNTVQEGLFLLDDKLIIGSQFSTATKSIFAREKLADLAFHDLLGDVVTERDMQLTKDYIDLLFGGRVNEKLIADINPLNQVEINIEKGGQFETKYLSFNFNRVQSDGKLINLLVTVNDISEKVNLQKEIEDLKEKSHDQLNMLINLLHVEAQTLDRFLSDTADSLDNINEIFRQPQATASDFRAKLDKIFRVVHKLKGEAAVLNMESFECRAHEFEDMLATLREQQAIAGNDFLPLAVKLNEFMTHHAAVTSLVQRFKNMKSVDDSGASGTETEPDKLSALGHLVNRIALEHGKKVEFHAKRWDLSEVPHQYDQVVWDIAVQLVRNSVVHGIETPGERLHAQKSDTGSLQLSLSHTYDGTELTVRDDGCGIDTEKILSKALNQGVNRQEDVSTWDKDKILSLIFEPGFTTASEISKDAGRGVGMDIIKEIVESVHGKLSIDTIPGQYCEFKILIPG